MLATSLSAAQKRATFRAALTSGDLLRFPGAHSPLIAMQLTELGFDGIYISGGALSADLGYPDIGLTTMSEVTQRGHQIARVTDLPTIIDIDTGFGEPMNAYRTVRDLEDLGLAGCHIEDQILPKRCGHLANKQLVDRDAMCRRVRAAADGKRDPNFVLIARTDSRAAEGLEASIDRALAYVDAGADVIFPEAMQDEREFETFRKAVSVPLLANMTEFGRSPLLSTSQLSNLGYNLVIYPVTSLRLTMHAVENHFTQIRDDGSQVDVIPHMQTRQRLYELLGYEQYNQFDEAIYNFADESHSSQVTSR